MFQSLLSQPRACRIKSVSHALVPMRVTVVVSQQVFRRVCKALHKLVQWPCSIVTPCTLRLLFEYLDAGAEFSTFGAPTGATSWPVLTRLLSVAHSCTHPSTTVTQPAHIPTANASTTTMPSTSLRSSASQEGHESERSRVRLQPTQADGGCVGRGRGGGLILTPVDPQKRSHRSST